VIDARDEEMGAWFEARIVKISPGSSLSSQQLQPQTGSDEASHRSLVTEEMPDDGFLYSIVFERSVCVVISLSSSGLAVLTGLTALIVTM